MKFSKAKIILIIICLIISFSAWYYYNVRPREPISREMFSNEIYFEFYEGGLSECVLPIRVNRIIKVHDSSEIDFIYKMFSEMDLDLFASNRDVDYSICINLKQYEGIKCNIEMCRKDGGYTFEFKGRLYRQDKLAEYIVDLFKIQYCNKFIR